MKTLLPVRWHFLKFVVILISCCFASTALIAGELQLVSKGKSNYRIVVAENADLTQLRAAELLQKYLNKISGAEIPVIRDSQKRGKFEILVGRSSRLTEKEWADLTVGLEEDGYLLKTSQRTLIIACGTGKGAVFGVTGLLEDHLGCRYYSPEVQIIPQKEDVYLKSFTDRQNPASVFRVIHGTFCEDPDYRDFRRLHTIKDVYDDNGWEGYWVHTFKHLLPAGKYFETHPEYFSLVSGKRVPYGQPCLTNPEVLRITIEHLEKEMKAHPDKRYWSVSQEDNYDYCRCEHCQASDEKFGGPSGTMMQFVNQVARRFPEKTITTLAYQYTRKPPVNVALEPNVMVMLCTIELNRSQAIETDPGSVSFKEDIIGWSKLCRNILLWDYEVQFTNYFSPFPLFHTLQPNIRFFNKYGTTAHFQQCNVGEGVELSELKAYLISKLLWNPEINADEVMNEFLSGFYNEAAPFVRSYIDLLHEEARKSGEGLDIYGTPVWNAKTFLSQENIERYYALFDQAEAAVSHRPEVVERVKVARLCVQYADMEIAKTDMFGVRGWYTIVDGEYVLKPERKQLLEDFYGTCKRNGIVEMNENGLTTDTYYENTKRFIAVETKGNVAFQKSVTCVPKPDAKYSANGLGTLTNGVKGTEDYKINWLGWQGMDAEIVVDLEKITNVNEAAISTLQFPKSWILHPEKITCLVSTDGKTFQASGTIQTAENLKSEPLIKEFVFAMNTQPVRYIKFQIHATKVLPAWHTYVGNPAWLFVDEVVVK